MKILAKLTASVAMITLMSTAYLADHQPPPSQDVQTVLTRAAHNYNLDPAVLRAIAYQESKFDENACSDAGACGVMQLMPATAKELGVGDRHNPVACIDGAARHLVMLLKLFDGNLGLALAAYNGGQNRVKKWLKDGARKDKLPQETRDYVRAITGIDVQVWAGKVKTIKQLIALVDESDHITRFQD